MEKHRYIGKTKEEAISNATIDLQETQDNLIIKELEEIKGGLFKSKKIEIEVVERREVIKYIKEYIQKLLKNLGFTANIEIKNKDRQTIDLKIEYRSRSAYPTAFVSMATLMVKI